MPFVLFIIFGLWLLAICANDRGKQILRSNSYRDNFPPCKHQEEFLLFWEYYLQYRDDQAREDPIGDALESAREDIWKSGYLPEPFKKVGMSGWKEYPLTRRTRRSLCTEVTPNEYPSFKNGLFCLEKYRAADLAYKGILESEAMIHVGKNLTWDYPKIHQYETEINKRWAKIMEPLNIHQFKDIYELPLASAFEYLLICERSYKMNIRNNPSCPFYDDLLYGGAQLEVLQSGYRPVSLKPKGARDFSEAKTKYVPSWPPDKQRLNDALEEDETHWSARPTWMFRNPSKFNDYAEAIWNQYQDCLKCFEDPKYLVRHFPSEGILTEYTSVVQDRLAGAAAQRPDPRYGIPPFCHIDRGECPPYDSCQECMLQNKQRL